MINLVKGQKIDLTKSNPSVKKFTVGLAWKPNNTNTGKKFDLDATAFILNSDDEVINVDLTTVPNNVKSIIFTINSYQGQTFDKVANCFARLVESVTNNEICVFKLAEKGSHTGMVMAKVYRHNGDWRFSALGIPTNGRTISDIQTECLQHA